jgi:S-adenosylmethionine-diacylgycerolhomoserine-N-methlytransferase
LSAASEATGVKGIDSEAHRAFLNRYYGVSRWFYDLSRKYYLLGRDETLRELVQEPWSTLVEVGPGTGRNLQELRRLRPSAEYGGVDASDAMLEFASRRVHFASLRHGFAETVDYAKILGRPPERILFSYCLSMVQDPFLALSNAVSQLAPGGKVVLVDFADGLGMPTVLRSSVHVWLEQFCVRPLSVSLLRSFEGRLSFGVGRYWVRGWLPSSAEFAAP